MRWLAALAALVAAATAVLAPSAGADVQAARPTLDVVSVEPLRVRGERFKSRERAVVTAWVAGRKAVVWARAGRRGAFVVTLPPFLTAGRCVASVRVAAVGSRGSRATVVLDHVACVATS